MGRLNRLFDTHCHLLPGFDDGSADWVESIDMARCAAADGICGIVVTPHQLGGYSKNTPDSIRRATGQLQRRFAAEGIPLQVFPGAEVRLEPDLVHRIRRGDAITLADRGRHVLVELPHEIYLPLEKILGQLRLGGLVAVLAHPERNSGVRRTPEVLQSLVDRGCLLQITAGSLLGKFGSGVQQLAEQLIGCGMAHLVATDAHGVRNRRPALSPAYDRIAARWGETTAMHLCAGNPTQVIEGNDTVPVRPGARRRSWGSRFRWRAAG